VNKEPRPKRSADGSQLVAVMPESFLASESLSLK